MLLLLFCWCAFKRGIYHWFQTWNHLENYSAANKWMNKIKKAHTYIYLYMRSFAFIIQSPLQLNGKHLAIFTLPRSISSEPSQMYLFAHRRTVVWWLIAYSGQASHCNELFYFSPSHTHTHASSKSHVCFALVSNCDLIEEFRGGGDGGTSPFSSHRSPQHILLVSAPNSNSFNCA